MHLRTKNGLGSAGRTESLPSTLVSLYGGLAGKITFVVMLREPLSRIHSHWFYETAPDMPFQEGIEGMMTRYGEELVWMSMYGQQLTEWVGAFSPEQFYVIPYLAYGSGNSSEIIRDLSQRIKFDMVNDDGGTVAHRNKNRHERPPLEELITPDFRARFDDYMAEDKAKLLQVLSEGHPKGMGLAKYSGKAGDQDEIDAWLQKWW